MPRISQRKPPAIVSRSCAPILELKIPQQVGNWELTEVAGRGSTAEVFLARPVQNNGEGPADYAVKRLRKEHQTDRLAAQMFRREAQCGHENSHPNLAPTLVSSVAQTPFYLVMPRLHGATLEQVLAAAGQIAIPRALWIARQVAEACEALHRQGWLHGDIKPGNVHADQSGHMTLFDFGFARRIGEIALCRDRMLMATLCYAAPELFTSSRVTGTASDVYGIGVMLYEMLCGQKPFGEMSAERLCEAHLTTPPPSPRTHVPLIPRSVSQFVSRMLAKDPDRRPSSRDELVGELARLEVEAFSLQ